MSSCSLLKNSISLLVGICSRKATFICSICCLWFYRNYFTFKYSSLCGEIDICSFIKHQILSGHSAIRSTKIKFPASAYSMIVQYLPNIRLLTHSTSASQPHHLPSHPSDENRDESVYKLNPAIISIVGGSTDTQRKGWALETRAFRHNHMLGC